jgi:hypothetical protein
MKILEVSNFIIREKFNKAKFYEKALNGEFQTWLKRNRHCEPPLPSEPDCTHSQVIYYYDKKKNIRAVVHQYRRPDGTIAGSGLPDPKYLVYRGVTYKTRNDHD